MDWKYEAVDKLRGYEAHNRALENIPAELDRLETAFVSVRSAVIDGMPISGGGNRREDIMLSNIVHRQELKRTLKQARLWVGMVDRALSALDEQERLVLERFYIRRGKGNVERLCSELGVEQSTVYRRRDSALRHFTLALYGVVEN